MKALPADYFARVYRDTLDPWGFETRWYEQRKYALTLASLPRARYANAFEPGCAIGVLSKQLASRCDRLTCLERMPAVAEAARRRLGEDAHVEVHVGALPEAWPLAPGATLDLAVLSEVLYYLTAEGLDEVLAKLDGSLAPGGHVVAVHYRGETDYPLRGDEVHERLRAWAARRGFEPLADHREPMFRLDAYERAAPRLSQGAR